MKRKPNYGQERAERNRLKAAKRNEKLEAKREKAARRKEEEQPPEPAIDAPTQGELP
jgi:hypothetical protein